MAVDVDYIRRIAGADPEEDAELLEGIRDAAVEWYEKAGVPSTTEGPLYRFWVANLAAWMYDNRGNADLNAAMVKVIMGEDISVWTKAVEAWYANGGQDITDEVTEYYNSL